MNSATNDRGLWGSELVLRIISAVILIIVVLSATWLGSFYFELMWAIVAFAIWYEFSEIVKSAISPLQKNTILVILLSSITAWIFFDKSAAILIAGSGIFLMLVWGLVFSSALWAPIVMAYAVVPFVAINSLRGDEVAGMTIILILFASVWGADILAYFAGKLIGGPKLAPKISPKKTWSGFIGGLIGSLLLVWAVLLVMGYQASFPLLALVLMLAVFAQIGDLAESALKRRFDVKDSSGLIPGHGGVLDRVDGLVFSTVVLWLFMLPLSDLANFPDISSNVFVDAFLLP